MAPPLQTEKERPPTLKELILGAIQAFIFHPIIDVDGQDFTTCPPIPPPSSTRGKDRDFDQARLEAFNNG
jgi:hypothetical protein